MEPITKEKLEQVKKFAGDLGFNGHIGYEGQSARFEIGLPSADINVCYEVSVCGPLNKCCAHAEVSIGWTSCDGGQVSIAQTHDFIIFMEYAVQIAEKLKEA